MGGDGGDAADADFDADPRGDNAIGRADGDRDAEAVSRMSSAVSGLGGSLRIEFGLHGRWRSLGWFIGGRWIFFSEGCWSQLLAVGRSSEAFGQRPKTGVLASVAASLKVL